MNVKPESARNGCDWPSAEVTALTSLTASQPKQPTVTGDTPLSP